MAERQQIVMKPPRGFKLTNMRVADGEVVYDVRIAWWRQVLLVVGAVRRMRVAFRGPSGG